MSLQKFAPGADVSLDVPLFDEAGAIMAPASVSFRILDESETVLQDWQPLDADAIAEDSATVVVPALFTTLTPPALRALRIVELQLETSRGLERLSASFMLQGVSVVSFGVNTFQTFPQAQLLAEDFVSTQLSGWNNTPARIEREQALIQAHERILRLPLQFPMVDMQSRLTADATLLNQFSSGTLSLQYLTPEQMAKLDPRVLKALCKAQLVEADEILNGDEISQARNSGLTSITVGESSQFFRGSKPLDLPVSPRALKFLERWLRFSARIRRS